MGQKTNPNIFRLGKTKNWTSQYFEKKSNEISLYSFKNLEIKKFIYKFFKDNEILLHNCKIYYLNENSLYIFFSYYLTFDSTISINSINKKQNIKFIYKKKIKHFPKALTIQKKPFKKSKKKNRLIIKKSIKNYIRYKNFNYFFNTLPASLQTKNIMAANKIIKLEKGYSKIRRLNALKNYKKYLIVKNYENIKTIETKNFLSKFFESLYLFLNKNINIFLTIQQLNKNFKQNFDTKKIKLLKKKLINLKKYEQNTFFKDGINIVFICITQKNSADLLAQFIANQLQKIKRHKFLLKFIKAALLLFNNNTFSNIQGMKIKIKGRFNGAPRARHKIIIIGKGVPNLTINAKIDYSEKTAYTSNGTFGVKVWIYEK